MSDVIDIGDFQFRRKQRAYWPTKDCQHRRLTLEGDGDIVTCTDCQKQVSAYWALSMLAEYYAESVRKITAREEQLRKDKEANIVLLAAKKVQSAWRSKNMVPCCPHCSRGILASDNLGGALINKAIELRRRESQQPN